MFQQLMACRFSYMELIDEQVGEVVKTLKELKLYEDTWIIFTADHGDMAGAHGYISKGSYMYDEIYRIPLIVKPAGTAAPFRAECPVHLMDVTATLLDIMEGRPVDTMDTHQLDGRSLVPIIAGEKKSHRDMHYGEYHGDWYGHYSSRMITDGRWKLVWNFSDHCELYDLRNDPLELENLFHEPAHHSSRKDYFHILKDDAKRLNDKQMALLSSDIEGRSDLRFDAQLVVRL